MKTTPLEESLYSHPFIMLKYMGFWEIDHKNPLIVKAYGVYKSGVRLLAVFMCFCMFVNTYEVLGDLKAMSWNICVNMVLIWGLIKHFYSTYYRSVINNLRKHLHQNATSRETPEDTDINKLSEKEMKYIRVLFYGTVAVFGPLWLVSFYFSYLWGPRQLPVPVYIPFDWDPEDELQYNLLFTCLGILGYIGVGLVLENEMAMMALLIQISREYKRLQKDLKNINQLCDDESSQVMNSQRRIVEVNPFLKISRIKRFLKNCYRNQQHLVEYTKDFEKSFSHTMLLQMGLLSIMMIILAVLCILEFDNLSLNLTYQLGYMILLLVDMFLVCWYSTRIYEQCLKIGDEAYGIFWYQMGMDIQKDICMMIRKSQHPAKITAGKFMEMNLNAFLTMLRNIYSWLTLFYQLAFMSE